jgi:hypothetical protein
VLVSYAIAEQGTNTLYLGLVDIIARRDYINQPYSSVEIEMILNYFPHDVWQDVNSYGKAVPDELASKTRDMSPIRQKFYYPLISALDQQWSDLTNESFLAIVQGLTLTGPDIFSNETANKMLNSFT